MAAEEGGLITYIFTCEEGEIIPGNATRFIAHESVTVIPSRLLYQHPNIVELICHAGVERIEEWAFYNCRRLKRVVIPGVKVVEYRAFFNCAAVNCVECPMLERIGESAFSQCGSLSNINLPSAKVVEEYAFYGCISITAVKFGKSLESIEGAAFHNCRSLERITIPLKDGIISEDYIFNGCRNLKHVDLVEGAVLRDTIAALLLEEWRNDMSEEINSINHILPNAPTGDAFIPGGKARAIREWIASVLHKIIHYKAEHRRLLTVASTSLLHALPNDIVVNYVLPFLELPLHTFEGEDHDHEEEEEDSNNSDDANDESYDTSDGGDDDNSEDGDDNSSNSADESHKASLGGGRHEEEGGDEVQRKRRKTTKDE